MAKSKNARDKLRSNKKLRRQFLTWLRMSRYGANNFTRNAWLTTAATAVMTITLLIVFTSLVARNILSDTITDLRQKIDISIYLNDATDDNEAEALREKLAAVEDVTSVRYIDRDEAKKSYVEQEKPSTEELQAISELPTNPFPASLRVTVADPNKLDALERLVENDQDFQAALSTDPNRQPTFAGERRAVIDNLANWTSTVERAGLLASIIFVAISMLIIFNTIRMAIFNRREEIQMMKLIGADRGFIRGPFVVEAVMYGFVAALVATALGVAGLVALEPKLESYGVVTSATRDLLGHYLPLLLLAMIGIGAFIGVVSSRLAVRRYLKV